MPSRRVPSQVPIQRLRASALAALAAVGVLAGPGVAPATAAPKKKPAPKLTALRCVPATAPACASGVRVVVGEAVLLRGKRIAKGQRVTFTWSDGSKTAKVKRRSGVGYVVTVPAGTPVGTVRLSVKDSRGRRSNRLKLKVVEPPVPGAATGTNALPKIFEGAGMWIADLSQAAGGDVNAIAVRAKASGIKTVFVKSGDGTTPNTQWNPDLVKALHGAGLQACAWQFIYGGSPEGEAALSVAAKNAGADCFVFNAENQYANRREQAQRYVSSLRAGVGADYPVGFSTFAVPSTDPRVPYSIFLGPGGAQANLPQIYWDEKDVDVPVAARSTAAIREHRIYGRPIAPIGQTFEGATPDDVQTFRSLWEAWGATGQSYFRFELTPDAIWGALMATPPKADTDDPGWLEVKKGDSGDSVRWVQKHLASFDSTVAIDGTFGDGTEAALRAFQESRGLTPTTGATGVRTWPELLKLPVKPG